MPTRKKPTFTQSLRDAEPAWYAEKADQKQTRAAAKAERARLQAVAPREQEAAAREADRLLAANLKEQDPLPLGEVCQHVLRDGSPGFPSVLMLRIPETLVPEGRTVMVVYEGDVERAAIMHLLRRPLANPYAGGDLAEDIASRFDLIGVLPSHLTAVATRQTLVYPPPLFGHWSGWVILDVFEPGDGVWRERYELHLWASLEAPRMDRRHRAGRSAARTRRLHGSLPRPRREVRDV